MTDLERAIAAVREAASARGNPGLREGLKALERELDAVELRARRGGVRLTKQEHFDLSIARGEIPARLRPFLVETAHV